MGCIFRFVKSIESNRSLASKRMRLTVDAQKPILVGRVAARPTILESCALRQGPSAFFSLLPIYYFFPFTNIKKNENKLSSFENFRISTDFSW